jgi:hypothetical protein
MGEVRVGFFWGANREWLLTRFRWGSHSEIHEPPTRQGLTARRESARHTFAPSTCDSALTSGNRASNFRRHPPAPDST